VGPCLTLPALTRTSPESRGRMMMTLRETTTAALTGTGGLCYHHLWVWRPLPPPLCPRARRPPLLLRSRHLCLAPAAQGRWYSPGVHRLSWCRWSLLAPSALTPWSPLGFLSPSMAPTSVSLALSLPPELRAPPSVSVAGRRRGRLVECGDGGCSSLVFPLSWGGVLHAVSGLYSLLAPGAYDPGSGCPGASLDHPRHPWDWHWDSWPSSCPSGRSARPAPSLQHPSGSF
jgi:hypothetical protein